MNRKPVHAPRMLPVTGVPKHCDPAFCCFPHPQRQYKRMQAHSPCRKSCGGCEGFFFFFFVNGERGLWNFVQLLCQRAADVECAICLLRKLRISGWDVLNVLCTSLDIVHSIEVFALVGHVACCHLSRICGVYAALAITLFKISCWGNPTFSFRMRVGVASNSLFLLSAFIFGTNVMYHCSTRRAFFPDLKIGILYGEEVAHGDLYMWSSPSTWAAALPVSVLVWLSV